MVATARRTKVIGIIAKLVACCGVAALVVMILGVIFDFRGITFAIWPMLSGFLLSALGFIVYLQGVNDADRMHNLGSFIGDLVYLLTSVVAFGFSGLPWAWAGALAIVGTGVLGLVLLCSNRLPMVTTSLVLLMLALLAALAAISLFFVTAQPTTMPAVTFGVLLLPLLAYGWVVTRRFVMEMCAGNL